MYERSLQSIREHLQKEDVQVRILHHIQKGRAEATVTISRAAELFEFTENKLRDWEKFGFLNPLRPVGPMGRRLYTLRDLDTLAIIRELIDAGYAPSDIPPDIDALWQSLSFPEQVLRSSERERLATMQRDSMLPINQYIEKARQEAAWRYFASRALRLALLLIGEDRPNTAAGLLLPLEARTAESPVQRVEDVATLGETLVGWLDAAHSSYTFLTPAPFFEYSTDYRLHPLQAMKAGVAQEAFPKDQTLIVVPRETRQLTLGSDIVATIRALLRPLYEDKESIQQCFGHGTHDLLEPATDLGSSAKYEDSILNGLAEMVVRLGGSTAEGHERWRFCCIFLPNHSTSILSLQQRSLVVRAQSRHSPHQIGITTLSSQSLVIGMCLSAFQSGHTIYLPNVSDADATTVDRELEKPVGSALAVPIENNDAISIGVIYVISEQRDGFAKNDQRVLRMIGKMVGELLETYQVRQGAGGKVRDLVTYPEHVAMLFKDFLSENEFIRDIEALLLEVQAREEELEEVVSFIAADIDNQSSIANKYGDRIARELAREVGLRMQGQLRAVKDNVACELYHINADKYYIILKGLGLEGARSKAELLRQVLAGPYQIDPMRDPAGLPALPENKVQLTNISVRLGVACYSYGKLKEVLLRFAPETAVAEFRTQIIGFLEEELNLGKREGGNVVMSWDPITRGFIRVSPAK